MKVKATKTITDIFGNNVLTEGKIYQVHYKKGDRVQFYDDQNRMIAFELGTSVKDIK